MAKFKQNVVAQRRKEYRQMVNGNIRNGKYYTDYSLGCQCFQNGKLPPKNASKAFREGWTNERDREIVFYLRTGSAGSAERLGVFGIVIDREQYLADLGISPTDYESLRSLGKNDSRRLAKVA